MYLSGVKQVKCKRSALKPQYSPYDCWKELRILWDNLLASGGEDCGLQYLSDWKRGFGASDTMMSIGLFMIALVVETNQTRTFVLVRARM